MVVDQSAVLHAHVAGVLHHHRVGNGVAYRHAARRIGFLRNAQLSGRGFRRHRRAGCASYVGVLRILTGRSHCVNDLAGVEVILRYRIGIGNVLLRLARSQVERRGDVGLRHQSIFKRNARNGSIAAVGDNYRVRHDRANLSVLRRARTLLDRQRGLDLFRIDRIAGLISLAVQRGGDRVLEAASRHVGRQDGVSRRGVHGRAGLHVIERGLRQRDALDLAEGDRLGFGVDVLYRNGKGNRLALGVLVVVRLSVVLRYNELRRNILVRNRQRAVDILDVVVVGNIRAAVHHDRSSRDVVTAADQSLAAGDRHARDLIRTQQACRPSILPPVVRQRIAVVFLAGRISRDRQLSLRDNQLAGDLVLCIDRVEGRDILTAASDGDRRGVEVTIIIGSNIGTAGRDVVRYRQDVALAKTFNLVFIRLNRFVRAGDLAADRVALLFSAGIGHGLVLNGDLEGRIRDLQGAEVLNYLVVVGVDRTPIDAVAVLRAARIGDRAGPGDVDFALIRRNKPGEARLAVRQRRAVIGLGGAAGGDGHLSREDLQTAGTDIEADAVVIVRRQVSQGDGILKVGVVARIGLGDDDILQPHGVRIIGRLARDRVPNIIQIFRLIAVMADDDVILDALVAVGEAGLPDLAVIDIAGPAVGLDTDGDVDLRHLQGAADVAERIVIIRMRRIRRRVLGRNGSYAGIDTAVVSIVIRVGIGERDAAQTLALGQTFDHHLAIQPRRQGQRRAVVLLAVALDGDGDLLLIEEGEFQALVSHGIGDLVIGTRFIAVVVSADDSLVELPAGDGRAGQGEGLAHLQVLLVIARDPSAVHVDEVDGDRGVPVAGVVERQHVLVFIRCKDQGLFDRIREEFDAFQFGVGRIERGIVDRRRQLDDRSRVAGNVSNRQSFRNDPRFRLASVLRRIDEIANLVAGGIQLRFVDEGDHVAFARQSDRLAVGHRTIAGNGNGLLGDGLADHEVRVGDDLVLGDLNIPRVVNGDRRSLPFFNFSQILNDIAQDSAAPVGINGGLSRDLGLPTEELTAIRRGVPVVKDKARLGGVRRSGDLPVLCNGLIGRQSGRSVIAVHKVYRVIRRGPLGVEHQVGRGHLVEGVRRRQTGIGIPACKRVVAVHAALRRGRRPDVRRLVDVGVKLDVRDRVKKITAVVVVDVVGVTVVVQVICGGILSVVAVIEGIAANNLRRQAIAIRIICLAICLGSGISIVIGVLEVVVYRKSIRRPPVGIPILRCSATW